jgi:hypothetical protein
MFYSGGRPPRRGFAVGKHARARHRQQGQVMLSEPYPPLLGILRVELPQWPVELHRAVSDCDGRPRPVHPGTNCQKPRHRAFRLIRAPALQEVEPIAAVHTGQLVP